MNLRMTRWLLYSIATIAIATGALLLAWATLSPLTIPTVRRGLRQESVASEPKLPARRISPEELAPLLKKPLQKPLYDQPPVEEVEVVEAPKKAPPLSIQLLATMIETENSSAMFATSGGQLEIRGQGEILEVPGGAVEIIEVHAGRVVLRYQNASIEMELQ